MTVAARVFGHDDDVAIAALILTLVWRAVPPEVWREHFPERAGDSMAQNR